MPSTVLILRRRLCVPFLPFLSLSSSTPSRTRKISATLNILSFFRSKILPGFGGSPQKTCVTSSSSCKSLCFGLPLCPTVMNNYLEYKVLLPELPCFSTTIPFRSRESKLPSGVSAEVVSTSILWPSTAYTFGSSEELFSSKGSP
jgi:hypothetical protein